jgi:hypothetical protein
VILASASCLNTKSPRWSAGTRARHTHGTRRPAGAPSARRRSRAAPTAPARPARGPAPPGRRPAAAPQQPPVRHRRAPSRCARCSATRAARTTRYGPPPHPTRYSARECTPPDETMIHGLVCKFAARSQQTSRSRLYIRADPAPVTKSGPARTGTRRTARSHGEVRRAYRGLRRQLRLVDLRYRQITHPVAEVTHQTRQPQVIIRRIPSLRELSYLRHRLPGPGRRIKRARISLLQRTCIAKSGRRAGEWVDRHFWFG